MTATTAASPRARTTAPSPAAGWTPAGRTAAAGALVGGGASWTAGELVGWGRDGTAQLAWMGAHPVAAGIGMTADLLGTLLLVGAAATWFALARRHSPRLARAGAGLLVVGLVAQAVVSGVEMAQFALVRDGGIPLARLAGALGSAADLGLAGYLWLPMFYLGAFLGVVVSMTALWRSRAVARPAIVLVVAFQVLQLVGGLPVTPVLLIGLTWMAVDVLRAGHRAPVGA